MNQGKFFHLFLVAFFLLLFNLQAKSATPNVDSMYALISGSWYLNVNCNGMTGQCNQVYSEDLHVIERIPGTDSLTWKKYQNGQLTSSVKYLLYFGEFSILNKDAWMIKTCQPCFKSNINVSNGRLVISADAFDGGGQIYGRTITGLLDKHTGDHALSLHPNPCTDVMYISDIPFSAEQITICDLHGNEVQTIEAPKGLNTPIDISSLPSGVFVVRIIVEERVFTGKIVKSEPGF